MIDHPRPRLAASAAVLVALLACLASLAAATIARAEGTIVYTKESLGQYQNQLNSGQIASVTINKRVRSLRITLKDGTHVLARYAPKQEPAYEAALKAKGIPVTALTPTEAKAEQKTKTVHHKIRYIAGGALIVILIIVGVVLFVNRRRKAAAVD